jgi:hypothetical protein
MANFEGSILTNGKVSDDFQNLESRMHNQLDSRFSNTRVISLLNFIKSSLQRSIGKKLK